MQSLFFIIFCSSLASQSWDVKVPGFWFIRFANCNLFSVFVNEAARLLAPRPRGRFTKRQTLRGYEATVYTQANLADRSPIKFKRQHCLYRILSDHPL